MTDLQTPEVRRYLAIAKPVMDEAAAWLTAVSFNAPNDLRETAACMTTLRSRWDRLQTERRDREAAELFGLVLISAANVIRQCAAFGALAK